MFDTHFIASRPATLNIAVAPKPSRAPQVIILRGLTLIEGHCRPITSQHLQVVDGDSDRLEIHVRGGMRHGQLKVGWGYTTKNVNHILLNVKLILLIS